MSEIDFQDGHCGGHLGLPIGTIFAIFDLEAILLVQCKFLNSNYPTFLEKKSKIGFQDGGYGGHFGFQIGKSFAIFHIHVDLLLHRKFQFKSPCGLREDVQSMFSRWRLWRPSWISDRHRHDFSIMRSRSILVAS